LAFLAIFINGIAAPGIYTVMAKLPYDIGAVRQRAKAGHLGARYAYASWLILLAVSTLLVGLIVLSLLA
jgi:hypothetical protein